MVNYYFHWVFWEFFCVLGVYFCWRIVCVPTRERGNEGSVEVFSVFCVLSAESWVLVDCFIYSFAVFAVYVVSV